MPQIMWASSHGFFPLWTQSSLPRLWMQGRSSSSILLFCWDSTTTACLIVTLGNVIASFCCACDLPEATQGAALGKLFSLSYIPLLQWNLNSITQFQAKPSGPHCKPVVDSVFCTGCLKQEQTGRQANRSQQAVFLVQAEPSWYCLTPLTCMACFTWL